MIGAIIGDIIGSRFEFNNHRSKEFELFDDDCEATDDSIMTLAIAKAIMETDKAKAPSDKAEVPSDKAKAPSASGFERDSDYYTLLSKMTVKYMQEIGRQYPRCGYGGSFARWVINDDPKPYNSYGNGAAMRISPAGYTARTEDEAIRLSESITRVTHNHPEGIKGAEATATAIFMARRGSTIQEIRDRIDSSYYPMDFTTDEIRDTYAFNETCQDTVPQAITAFLESTSFEDAIRIAISIGGDSDTVAAITGSIAEAFYGVPKDIRNKALEYLNDDLRAIYDEWSVFAAKENTPHKFKR